MKHTTKPRLDGILWLQLLGQALCEMGIASNRRVVVAGYERTGTIRLDLEFLRTDGRREFEPIAIPVQAANDHDTGHVLRCVASHSGITAHDVDILKGVILQETSLGHVH